MFLCSARVLESISLITAGRRGLDSNNRFLLVLYIILSFPINCHNSTNGLDQSKFSPCSRHRIWYSMISPSITELIYSRAINRTQISWPLSSVSFSHSKLTDKAKSVPKVCQMLIRFLQTQTWSKLWSSWNILNQSSFSSSAWVKAHSSCQRSRAEFLCFEFLCYQKP